MVEFIKADTGISQRDTQSRQMQYRANTARDEDMSVEFVISTSQPVRMYSWEHGEIDEVLRSDGMTHMDHVVALDSHQRFSIANNLGDVRDIRIVGDEVHARIYFDADMELARTTYNKIKKKFVRACSIGYEVTSHVRIAAGETAVVSGTEYTADARRDLIVALAYQIREVSVVLIGADDRAVARSFRSIQVTDTEATRLLASRNIDTPTSTEPVETKPPERSEDSTIPADDGNLKGENVMADPATTPVADDSARQIEDARKAGIAAERSRVSSIREIGKKYDVRSETIDKGIEDADCTPDSFRDLALEDVHAQRGASSEPVRSDAPNIILAGNRHERDCTTESLGAAVALRMGLKDPTILERINHDPVTGETTFEAPGFRSIDEERKEHERNVERASKYRNMHSVDLLREGLRIAQVEAPMERRQIATRAISTPGVSSIYTTATSALLLQHMGNQVDSTQGWVAEREANSFKAQELHALEGGKLARRARGKKAEQAEFSDLVESYKCYEFARTLLIDRQNLIDDEIGAWQTALQEFARAILAVRPDLVYSVLMTNAPMTDTNALFSAAHNNDLTGALGQAQLQVALTAMMNQRSSAGVNLNLEGKHLITSSTAKYVGRQLANSGETRGAAAENGTVNPVAEDNLIVHGESRLATGFTDPVSGVVIAPSNHFYLAADMGAYGLTYGTLAGTNGQPTVNSKIENSGGVYGLNLDVAMVGGCGVSNHRGLVRSV